MSAYKIHSLLTSDYSKIVYVTDFALRFGLSRWQLQIPGLKN